MARPLNLPSLSMLATFEAAARLGAFNRAAESLGVTASAVSHQIKNLEKAVGVTLFIRKHKEVRLSEEGRVLYEACARGFGEIETALTSLQARKFEERVSIGATTAVSSLWLTPQITQFWREYGDVAITQEVRDRPYARPIELEFVIEYTTKRPQDATALLFHDRLVPLAAPGYSPQPLDLDALKESALIHLDAKETNWTSWPKWFEAHGYHGPIASRHRVNNYSIALQLAQDGLGVVLGWKRLVAPLIRQGVLEPISDLEIDAPGAFYLIENGAALSANAALLKAWLIGRLG